MLTSWTHLRLYQYEYWLVTVHSWQLYSAALLREQTTSIMMWFPTTIHYPNTELTSPCPRTVMPSARLDNDKYNFCKLLVWLDWDSKMRPSTHTQKPALYWFGPPGLVSSDVDGGGWVMGTAPWCLSLEHSGLELNQADMAEFLFVGWPVCDVYN